jgi:hypothetical protein
MATFLTTLLVLLLTISCSNPKAAISFPDKVGAWTRGPSDTHSARALPGFDVRRTDQAVYSAEGAIHVTAYELASETVAFEAAQKFRAQDAVGFHKGTHFYVASSPDLSRESVAKFAGELQQTLP